MLCGIHPGAVTSRIGVDFLLRTLKWLVGLAVAFSRATRQKSESCEEYRCYDFRNCPVCHLLAYAYFVLILQSKIGRNRGSKIVLIDGSRLAELMIEFSVAVATDTTYTVKRIDNDFFESI